MAKLLLRKKNNVFLMGKSSENIVEKKTSSSIFDISGDFSMKLFWKAIPAKHFFTSKHSPNDLVTQETTTATIPLCSSPFSFSLESIH